MSKRCSVVNCRKEVEEGQYKVINGKIYCIQCAILLYKETLHRMGVQY